MSEAMDDFDRATMELRIAGGGNRDSRACAAFLAGFGMSTENNFGAGTAHIEDEAWFEKMGSGFDAWWERETVSNFRNRWSQLSDEEIITVEGAIREAMTLGIADESIELLKPIADELLAEHERRRA